MKCLYYPAPTLESAHRISGDLRAAGLSDFYVHIVSKDEAGLKNQHLHSSNYFETLDVIRDGLIGSAIGFIAGLIGVALLRSFEPFGPNVPGIVYVATVAMATLFGAWEGGLTGIATENRKLAGFHKDIEAGLYLILVYTPQAQEAAVRELMRTKHPEAALAAVDRHFMNPFIAVKLGSDAPRPRERGLLQRG